MIFSVVTGFQQPKMVKKSVILRTVNLINPNRLRLKRLMITELGLINPGAESFPVASITASGSAQMKSARLGARGDAYLTLRSYHATC